MHNSLCFSLHYSIYKCNGSSVKSVLVYGESDVSLSEAVRNVNGAISNARTYGYRPISVGGGVGSALNEVINDYQFSVIVILEGPGNAPDLMPETGKPIP